MPLTQPLSHQCDCKPSPELSSSSLTDVIVSVNRRKNSSPTARSTSSKTQGSHPAPILTHRAPLRLPAMDLDTILGKLETGEQELVQKTLTQYNKENSQCFFFSTEQREQRKKLGEVVVKFLDRDLQPSCQVACLETIRILSRDKYGLSPFTSRSAMHTLAKYAGLDYSDELEVPRIPDSESVVEALKGLCNIVYNSVEAQEVATDLRLVCGLARRLKLYNETRSSHECKFFDLRLLFLLTALRVDVRRQLARELRGISLLTDALESTLALKWSDIYEVVTDRLAPPLGKEETERVMEILKTLFNITFDISRREVDEEDAALYRHLAAILRHCLIRQSDGDDRTEEFHGHTVNLLVNLPLMCLDVLLTPKVELGSVEYMGMNMDTVEVLLQFLDRRLDRGHKLRETLTPVLNLLTESSRVHRETRKFLRAKVLPPLRDVKNRPEVGNTLRNKLVRLMTHVDTDVKHCAAEFLFVLCKENVSRFVKYTGYGNAAGLLAVRGLLAGGRGEGHYSEDEDTDTEEYREAKPNINPVTGRVEEKLPNPMDGMTEEQKEYEAMKLVSMFDKLSREQIIQPMGVTSDGRLKPLDEAAQKMLQQQESSDLDSDSD
ncbi:synembryn-A isoform X3 [Pelobates fuscus]|uniref:synembryn-A isoform X3 n=1 Tax=Pelobates fuscus TaxID=191477 RepID=UPI002FE496FE